jgi:hypothetical protein
MIADSVIKTILSSHPHSSLFACQCCLINLLGKDVLHLKRSVLRMDEGHNDEQMVICSSTFIVVSRSSLSEKAKILLLCNISNARVACVNKKYYVPDIRMP